MKTFKKIFFCLCISLTSSAAFPGSNVEIEHSSTQRNGDERMFTKIIDTGKYVAKRVANFAGNILTDTVTDSLTVKKGTNLNSFTNYLALKKAPVETVTQKNIWNNIWSLCKTNVNAVLEDVMYQKRLANAHYWIHEYKLNHIADATFNYIVTTPVTNHLLSKVTQHVKNPLFRNIIKCPIVIGSYIFSQYITNIMTNTLLPEGLVYLQKRYIGNIGTGLHIVGNAVAKSL